MQIFIYISLVNMSLDKPENTATGDHSIIQNHTYKSMQII